ncbi:nuclear transport factor 2 family protein [Rhizobium jaguaris]|uniref:Steroid delta-isomerase n=1 Tax=Rhizobium jaguaris TaxID=1312183 RepID=A0A387FGX5_9HYPH|nr:nuclear transport factor 2 family protein [Rhizobium jaguaris]AYG57779.1 steroid delta-isomerase [Rhizobium jaguaris]
MTSQHSDPTHPVRMQLDAYNARDIDTFMQWWSDDCEYYQFPSTLLAKGVSEIRERHITRFREPDLFGELISRMAVGNMVVDQEVVTRNFPEGRGEVDVICIYEIENGKIAKAWFKMGLPRLNSPAEK